MYGPPLLDVVELASVEAEVVTLFKEAHGGPEEGSLRRLTDRKYCYSTAGARKKGRMGEEHVLRFK